MEVKSKTRRYKMTKKGLDRETPAAALSVGIETIRVWLAAGMSASEVARRCGTARSSLYVALRRHWGLAPQRHLVLVPYHEAITHPDAAPVGTTTLGVIRQLLVGGRRYGDMARETGMSRDMIAYHLRLLGFRLEERTRLVPASTTTKKAKS